MNLNYIRNLGFLLFLFLFSNESVSVEKLVWVRSNLGGKITETETDQFPHPKFLLKYKHYDEIIKDTANRHSIDPLLIHAIVANESSYQPNIVSKKGAVGLMQLMPTTAKRFGGVDLISPIDNINTGTAYLRHLLNRFNNRIELALAGYNAGESAVIRYGHAIPPYKETVLYVDKVMSYYNNLLSLKTTDNTVQKSNIDKVNINAAFENIEIKKPEVKEDKHNYFIEKIGTTEQIINIFISGKGGDTLR